MSRKFFLLFFSIILINFIPNKSIDIDAKEHSLHIDQPQHDQPHIPISIKDEYNNIQSKQDDFKHDRTSDAQSPNRQDTIISKTHWHFDPNEYDQAKITDILQRINKGERVSNEDRAELFDKQLKHVRENLAKNGPKRSLHEVKKIITIFKGILQAKQLEILKNILTDPKILNNPNQIFDTLSNLQNKINNYYKTQNISRMSSYSLEQMPIMDQPINIAQLRTIKNILELTINKITDRLPDSLEKNKIKEQLLKNILSPIDTSIESIEKQQNEEQTKSHQEKIKLGAAIGIFAVISGILNLIFYLESPQKY